MSEAVGDIGLIGLAVMGQNLILNIADHKYDVVAYNRTTSKVDHFLENEAKPFKNIHGAHSIAELAKKLKKPRRVILLVKAGDAVDNFINQLIEHFEPGDIIIDGGNSNFNDSNRRYKELKDKGFLFVGMGVSGGEDGARYGPSLMPGGDERAWPHLKSILQDVAAKSDNEPCCDWIGPAGSGHFVKMVHNGIEYGDMQLISEAYDMMRKFLKISDDEISKVFDKWNSGVLDSFLVEITRDICAFKDKKGEPLVEKILDQAGQKGTGKWTSITALDIGMPLTLVSEAVLARCLSSIKGERVTASKHLEGPSDVPAYTGDKQHFIDALEQALYASKIISYAQGFQLIRAAGNEFGWKFNNAGIGLMWRGGCIIRSVFLADITAAFREKPDLENLLFYPFFNDAIHKAQKQWREIVALAVQHGVPTPCFTTAISFYDGYRSARLPANLLQAQRDYFGAHTFRVLEEAATDDHPANTDIHVNWTGHGGNVSSSTYIA